MNKTELNILIVDDVAVVRKSLTKILQQLGFINFFEAENIQDAWEVIETESIELIMCDWNMQNGDGIDLLNKIRSHNDESINMKKFIMITGAENKSMAAMDAGAHNIVHKPFVKNNIDLKIRLIFN
jgi:two-component system, chemotaxis family, chemotaxis protein CheY